MRLIILTAFLFLVSGLSFGQSSFVNTFSSVSYNSSTNQVTGYAYTEPSYLNYLYYNTHVNGGLFNFNGGLLDYESGNGGSSIAEIWLSANGNGCDYYQMSSSHFQTMVYWVQDYWWSGQYFTGYWDEYNYYSFNGGTGGPGPYQGQFTYFGPGPSYSTYSDHIIFDGTETWTEGDCGVVPTATITQIKAVGKGQTALVHVEVDNPDNENITLTLNPFSTTGSAKFTGTGGTNSNIRTITSTGDVEITGVTENNTPGSMRMEAKLASSGTGVILSRMDFTVISVTLSLRYQSGQSISADNSRSVPFNTLIGRTTLGGPTLNSGTVTPREFSNVIEIVGTILPSNFSESVKLNRTTIESLTFTGQSIVGRLSGCPDTSGLIIRDVDPQSGGSNGKVYDLDSPGLIWPESATPGLIGRRRTNFTQWATVFQAHGNNEADVRVSGDISWFNRISIVKNSGLGSSLANDVANDNAIGAGTTSLAWDLTGSPPSPLPTPDTCPQLEQPQ